MVKTKKGYQELNSELETVITALENPDIDVEKTVELYGRGIEIIKQLQTQIKTAENTVRKLQSGLDPSVKS